MFCHVHCSIGLNTLEIQEVALYVALQEGVIARSGVGYFWVFMCDISWHYGLDMIALCASLSGY